MTHKEKMEMKARRRDWMHEVINEARKFVMVSKNASGKMVLRVTDQRLRQQCERLGIGFRSLVPTRPNKKVR